MSHVHRVARISYWEILLTLHRPLRNLRDGAT